MPTQLSVFADFTYFLAIFLLSLSIYIQTRSLLKFSHHRGIGYFRNSYLYFSIIYFFRLTILVLQLLGSTITVDATNTIQSISLFLVIYFSFAAILSLLSSFSWRKYSFISDNRLHLASLFLASVGFFAKLPSILVIAGIVAVLFLFLKAYDNYQNKRRVFSQLFIIYILLVFFILFDLLPATQELVPFEVKLAGYIGAVSVFVYINVRVKKVLAAGKEEEK